MTIYVVLKVVEPVAQDLKVLISAVCCDSWRFTVIRKCFFFFKQLSHNTFMSNIRAWYVVICKLPRYCLSMSFPGWWNWLLRTQKSLVPRIKWPLFVINIVEMGLNDQDTDCMWHWKLWNWLLRTQKSLVTWIKWPLFVLNIIEMGLNDEDTDCM